MEEAHKAFIFIVIFAQSFFIMFSLLLLFMLLYFCTVTSIILIVSADTKFFYHVFCFSFCDFYDFSIFFVLTSCFRGQLDEHFNDTFFYMFMTATLIFSYQECNQNSFQFSQFCGTTLKFYFMKKSRMKRQENTMKLRNIILQLKNTTRKIF